MTLVVAGGCLLGLLATARTLEPSPEGYGTHQQLGLPQCTSIYLFGVRCPSCGMTTSWAQITRGRVWAAFCTNAGGSLLAVSSMVVAPWALLSGLRGRWLVVAPNGWVALVLLITLMAVTLADWTIRLLLN